MEQPAKQAKTEAAADEDGSARTLGSAFFASLKLSPSEHLDREGKIKCGKCQRSMKYYCSSCLCRLDDDASPGRTPVVTLPVALEIIHHPTEKTSKSTAVHAVVLSPQATMHEFPDVPEYDPADTVLLFPSPGAVDICEYQGPIRRVVVVDSQWQKTKSIVGHANLARLPCVVISKRNTFFWRYQPKEMGDDFLATIEAIYYFYRDYQTSRNPGVPYDGSVDDLLYFYAHQWKVIQDVYKQSGKSFKRIPKFLE